MSIVLQFSGTKSLPGSNNCKTSRRCLGGNVLRAALVVQLVTSGCGSGVQEKSKISVTCVGRTSTDCDHSVALPLMQSLAVLPKVKDFLSLSRAGSVEMYVTCDGPQDSQALDNGLSRAAKLLPADIDQPTFAVLAAGSPIPTPETGDEEVVAIHVDRERLQILGLTFSAVAQLVSTLTGPVAGPVAGPLQRSLEEIESTPLSAGEPQVLLRDVAAVRLELQPRCVVRHNLSLTQ